MVCVHVLDDPLLCGLIRSFWGSHAEKLDGLIKSIWCSAESSLAQKIMCVDGNAIVTTIARVGIFRAGHRGRTGAPRDCVFTTIVSTTLMMLNLSWGSFAIALS